jgi:parallel beta-helix repeat protein
MHGRVVDAARCAARVLSVVMICRAASGVDGVTEINQPRAVAGGVTPGDGAGFPVTLDHPGSYRLTGNLVVDDPATTAIVVGSSDVTIDLNGFTISCNTGVSPCGAGAGHGIDASSRVNVAISNGTVREMGGDGIITGANARIERVRLLANHHNGATTGNNSALAGNTATNSGNDGMTAGVSSTLTNNTARDNGRGGIETSSNCTISGNTLNNNDVFGVYCNGGCTIDRNTANENGTGVSLLGGNTIVGNTIRNNTNFGIVAIGTDTGYSQNTLTGNNGGGNAAQVSGGTPIGANSNFCGTDTTCP